MERKYTASSVGPRIEDFLGAVIGAAGFDLRFAIEQGQRLHPDFEDPEVVVKFSGTGCGVAVGESRPNCYWRLRR